MTTTVTNTTLPIQQRGGLLFVLRYGKFAGEGYAGRFGLQTTTHENCARKSELQKD